mmetsp:Transcript_10072/g.23992  ORF Transcript_10072/g.23992 Transcript_10072/m.23992 type:complete len:393 (+) Transcript_10072:117-1295(+)
MAGFSEKLETEEPHEPEGGGDPHHEMKRQARSMGVAIRSTQGGTVRMGSEFDVPEDTYGAAIVAIIKEFSEVGTSSEAINIVRCVFAMALLLLNLVLQFSCLYFIEHYVVAPSVHHVQMAYAMFHRRIFDDNGVYQPDAWHKYENKAELCQIAMTNKTFYYTVILLWTVSCLQEFRTGQRLVVNISCVPHAESGDQMFIEDDDSQKISVVAITRRVRWLLYLLVCAPKIGISFMLLRLGLRWLSATTSFEAMVMNAVAMTFVVQIDELLYHFALPAHYRKQVGETDIFIEEEAVSVAHAEWWAYYRSSLYVLAAAVIVVLYAEIIQDILPSEVYEAANICHEYLNQHLAPLCTRSWEESLTASVKVFTQGVSAWSTASCYPYGQSGEVDFED